MASRTISTSSTIESMTTRHSGSAATIWRVASIPFISGIMMSINTIRGCLSRHSATASRPLAASATTSKQPDA
jgi:hypothetical protein